MQHRRGTNRERLGITPVEGEVLYVTDFKLSAIEVTTINVTTNVLTTALSHGLIVGQRVKFIGPDNTNGIASQGVYYVKTAPDATNFTLSTTLNGATLDITGTSGTVSIDLVIGPTDSIGVPVGNTVSPLWAGDGVTAGGNPAGATILDDLYDVEIGTYGNVNEYGVAIDDGQMLAFNEITGMWENVHTVSVANYAQTINHQREQASADLTPTTLNTALRVTKRITDSASPANLGGPGIAFNAVGTDNTNHLVAQIGATYNSSTGPDVLLQTTNDGGTTFVSTVVSSQARTNINQGVLYVDKASNTVGINNTSPGFGLDVTGTTRISGATQLDSTLFVSNTITANNGTILTNSGTATVMNTNATTVNAFGAATNMTLGATTGTTTIRNANTVVTGDLAVNGGDITTSSTTGTVFNTTATTVNIGGAATAVNIGSTTGTTTVKNDLSVTGNLSVFGTSTNIDTTDLVIEDNVITLNKNEAGAGVSTGVSGIEIERGTQANVNWQFNETGFTWETTNNANIYSSGTVIANSTLGTNGNQITFNNDCLLYTSPSPRDRTRSRMPSSA